MKIKAFLIGLLIGLYFMIPIISLKIKNDKLEKENVRLKQQIFDYKWQLEQVKWIFKTME